MRREYPERPVVAVGVVVWRRDSVLLVRRANPPRAGEWSLPGGRIELGETVAAAAAREVREETGLDIEVLGVVDVVDSIQPDAEGRVRFHYVLVDVAARWTGGRARAGDDAVAVRWVTADAVPGLGLWRETERIIGLSRPLAAAAAGNAVDPDAELN